MHIGIVGFSGDINLFVRTICAASMLLITKIAALVLNTINIVIYSSLATNLDTNPVYLILGFVITGIIEMLLILEVIFDVFLFIGLYKKKMVAHKVFGPSVICYIFEAIVYVYLMPMITFKFPVIPYFSLDIFMIIVNVTQLVFSAVLLIYIGSYHANVRDGKVKPPYISHDMKFVNDFIMWTTTEPRDTEPEENLGGREERQQVEKFEECSEDGSEDGSEGGSEDGSKDGSEDCSEHGLEESSEETLEESLGDSDSEPKKITAPPPPPHREMFSLQYNQCYYYDWYELIYL